MVRLQMLFDCDMPTTIEKKVAEEFQGSSEVREEWRMTGMELARLCPPVRHWIIQNGYQDCDLVLTVNAQEEHALDQSVEQQPVL
jgi:hypothetical protein